MEKKAIEFIATGEAITKVHGQLGTPGR